eukprot:TRINITY_DN5383_c0_g3_i2.p1 TRINITY_DN5383_c0_g3~~TRINITY_DN5383_c0_g3_i2.p1  ORF type:complete len:522 (+),score=105.05 TRINITY_DN5383_c0_g3_i2:155-1720(+)
MLVQAKPIIDLKESNTHIAKNECIGNDAGKEVDSKTQKEVIESIDPKNSKCLVIESKVKEKKHTERIKYKPIITKPLLKLTHKEVKEAPMVFQGKIPFTQAFTTEMKCREIQRQVLLDLKRKEALEQMNRKLYRPGERLSEIAHNLRKFESIIQPEIDTVNAKLRAINRIERIKESCKYMSAAYKVSMNSFIGYEDELTEKIADDLIEDLALDINSIEKKQAKLFYIQEHQKLALKLLDELYDQPIAEPVADESELRGSVKHKAEETASEESKGEKAVGVLSEEISGLAVIKDAILGASEVKNIETSTKKEADDMEELVEKKETLEEGKESLVENKEKRKGASEDIKGRLEGKKEIVEEHEKQPEEKNEDKKEDENEYEEDFDEPEHSSFNDKDGNEPKDENLQDNLLIAKEEAKSSSTNNIDMKAEVQENELTKIKRSIVEGEIVEECITISQERIDKIHKYANSFNDYTKTIYDIDKIWTKLDKATDYLSIEVLEEGIEETSEVLEKYFESIITNTLSA